MTAHAGLFTIVSFNYPIWGSGHAGEFHSDIYTMTITMTIFTLKPRLNGLISLQPALH